MKNATETEAAFGRLYEVARTLRGEHGCPWDKDQTPLSLRRDLMEEAFEAIDAITQGDTPHVREELGDVLFNAVLLAFMYEQAGDFTVQDVLNDISEKLIRRHPHVFPQSEGNTEMKEPVQDSSAVLNQWDRIKENLEGRKGDSVLDSVPQGFPPLLKAYKQLSKAAKKHFEWESAEDALHKVQEEMDEVAEAVNEVAAVSCEQSKPFTVSGGSPALTASQLHLEEEIGDALFAFVNYARVVGVDSAIALERANRKFYRRFTHVEKRMAETATPMDSAHASDMQRFWDEAKAQE